MGPSERLMRENLRWAYVGSLERTEFLKFLHYPIRTLQARAQPCWQPTLTNMAGFPAALSSPPMSDIPRPTMRRKSSAQNLLSSFKPPASGPTPGGSISSATGAAYAAAVQTPTATVSPGREWDGQSVQSDSLSSTATLVANGTPAIAQGTSVEYLRDLVQKRIVTLTYMRNVHEGCVGFLLNGPSVLSPRPSRSHWFHTIMMSRGELDRVFNNVAMKKRCVRQLLVFQHRSATIVGQISLLSWRCPFPTCWIFPKHMTTFVACSTL
jgi:hypothetical protein